MKSNFYRGIPKVKAELPLMIVFTILGAVIVVFHNGFFGWKGSAISGLVVLGLLLFFYYKRKGDYFVEVDKEGIRWRQSLIGSYTNIPWKYLQRIDYLEFEINFMLKETAQVVSFPTSGLTDEDTVLLKETISDLLKEKEA